MSGGAYDIVEVDQNLYLIGPNCGIDLIVVHAMNFNVFIQAILSALKDLV